jgi:hypothetical protein
MFLGYAMWNYLATSFCFTMPGFKTRELEPHSENGQIWRMLEITFPENVPTHCRVQKFYYDETFHAEENGLYDRRGERSGVILLLGSERVWWPCVSDIKEGGAERSRNRQADT